MKVEYIDFVHRYLKNHERKEPTSQFDWRYYTQFFQDEFSLRTWEASDQEIEAGIRSFYQEGS